MADTIADVLGDSIQVVPKFNLNPTTPISIDIYPGDPFREQESAGFGEIDGLYAFTVRARVTDNDIDAAQEQLLNLMDDEHANCIAAALEADQTLGGRTSAVHVQGPTGFRGYEDNPGVMLGVQWRVRVINNPAFAGVAAYGDGLYGEGTYGGNG